MDDRICVKGTTEMKTSTQEVRPTNLMINRIYKKIISPTDDFMEYTVSIHFALFIPCDLLRGEGLLYILSKYVHGRSKVVLRT